MFLTWALPKRPIFEEFAHARKCHAIIITHFHLKKIFVNHLFLFVSFLPFFFRSISTNKSKKNDVGCNIPALELKSQSQNVYAFFCAAGGRWASNASPEATSSLNKCTHFDSYSTTSCDIRAIFVWPWNENARTKEKQQTNGNRAIWLVYRTDTNARGFWLVKRTLGWKNFMPENFLEINRYFALTSYCNTIGQWNNAFSILGFSLAGKRWGHVLIFSSIGW